MHRASAERCVVRALPAEDLDDTSAVDQEVAHKVVVVSIMGRMMPPRIRRSTSRFITSSVTFTSIAVNSLDSPKSKVKRYTLNVERFHLPTRITRGRDDRACRPHARRERVHPVPGTVEIASEHEIATSAAVPGTDMEIEIRGWQPRVALWGDGRGEGLEARSWPAWGPSLLPDSSSRFP